MRVDARAWHKANLWRAPSGELCVRPGLRQLFAPDSGKRLVGGFSVLNSYTPEVWHYTFDVNTSGALGLRLVVRDETFQVVQSFAINADVVPRVITAAIVEGLGLITSPDFPTLFFVVGSGVRFAESVASDNPATTAVAVPRGICCVWGRRILVADGRAVWGSDPVAPTGGDPRTFTVGNRMDFPGVVFGMHEARDGDAVFATSEGVYAAASEYSTLETLGNAAARMVNHARSVSYASTCVVRGRVYGLTRDGWAPFDTETDAEARLTEPLMPRAVFPRVALDDYRTARMYGTDEGPLVAHDGLNAVHRTDVVRGMGSWWRSSFAASDFKVRGVLRELDGTELLLCENGVFAVAGDIDGAIALTSEVGAVTGSLFGVLPPDPKDSRLVRHVDVVAAVGGTSSALGASVRGSRKTAAMPPDGNGLTIDVSDWAEAGRRLTATPMTTLRVDYGPAAVERTDDVGVEVEVKGCGNRVAESLAVTFAESARERPARVV